MAQVRYDGRVAIVTGAGSGIGREYSLELAKRGAKVVVNDLGGARDGTGASAKPADNVVQEIKAAGGEAVANYDSVATVEGGKGIVQTALDAFGRVDILINNAGILRDRSFLKMSELEWDTIMAVHLKGAFCVTQPAVAAMREKGYGRIIFTTSTTGLYGNFGQTNYGAAKLGLAGFMLSLKLETAKYDIKVNTIAPTAWSRLTEDIMPKEVGEKLRPQFNVPLVLYLCSEDNQANGMTFVMGGGWYARAAMLTGPGARLGDGVRDIAVEEIRDSFGQITSLENPRLIDKGMDAVGFMVKP